MKRGLGSLYLALACGAPVQLWAQVDTPPPSGAANPSELAQPDQLQSRPRFISGTQPGDAPEVVSAVARGGYGNVVAQATVTPVGTVTDILILESSGLQSVDDAVVRALGTWKLTAPIDKAGKKVGRRAKFPFALGHFPERISANEPEFPGAAKAAFHNGRVLLAGKIDIDGKVVDVRVSRSSKSQLLDDAAVAAVSAYRYAPPKNLAGNPASINITQEFRFSQAETSGGSYLSGPKTYKCSTFVGETDWWAQANPQAKPSDQEFNVFIGGVASITPESLGWGKIGIADAAAKHTVAWQHALTACRDQPDSTFIEQYKKG